jgi:hypothetical protein
MSKVKIPPPAPGLLDDWVSREDCARQLATSPRTLQRWEARGKGPPVARIGLVPWYHFEETKKWILEQSRAPSQEHPETSKVRSRKRNSGRGRV